MSDHKPSPAQRWFVLGLIVLFIALSGQYTIKILDPSGKRSAIMRWREQLLDLDRGENIYDRYVYPNPPIMALALKPLADIDPGFVGALLWYYLKVGATLASLYWVFRLVQGGGLPFPAWAKALVVLLSLRPIMSDLTHGNVNLFILFLVTAGLYAFHKGRPVGGGLLLALSIACKVTPALFVPYLIWKRAWRALAGCAVGLVLFLWVVPSCFLGWEKNQELLTSWTRHMIVPFLIDGEVTSSHENQSLPGLAARLLTHSPSFIDYDPLPPHGPRPQRYDNLLDLSLAAASRLVKGAELLFVGLVVWRCRRPLAPRAGWRLAAEFSVIVLGMLLFSERTWKHHCVTLMLPFAVLCYYLSACRPGFRLKCYLIGTLVVVTLLMASTSSVSSEKVNVPHFEQGWEAMSKTAQVYGVYVWAYLLLLAALGVVLGRKEESLTATEAEAISRARALPALPVVSLQRDEVPCHS
ncbi:MAG TPA: glycosyltransferase family 87 protein [Gemmataceae bacterium]|nr:glycosyltransferase family 87 protein [Gemmataceae bacterium]